MEFLYLLWSEENYIFSAAIFLMLGIAVLEGLLMVVGFGISNTIQHMFPNIDAPELELQTTEINTFTEFFSWLKKGKVPVLMLFIVFLTVFGLIGLGLQYLTMNKVSQYIMIIPTLIVSLPIVSYTSLYLSKIMPRDETTAVSKITFVGKIAEITNGTTMKGMPTEAKVVDDFNYTHYIMVEPLSEAETFKKGDKVLVYSIKNDTIFYITEESVKN